MDRCCFDDREVKTLRVAVWVGSQDRWPMEKGLTPACDEMAIGPEIRLCLHRCVIGLSQQHIWQMCPAASSCSATHWQLGGTSGIEHMSKPWWKTVKTHEHS